MGKINLIASILITEKRIKNIGEVSCSREEHTVKEERCGGDWVTSSSEVSMSLERAQGEATA